MGLARRLRHAVLAAVTVCAQATWQVALSESSEEPQTRVSEVALPPAEEVVLEESEAVVRGVIEGFLRHERLPNGEVECLAKGAAGITGDMLQVCDRLALMLGEAVLPAEELAAAGLLVPPAPVAGGDGNATDGNDTARGTAGKHAQAEPAAWRLRRLRSPRPPPAERRLGGSILKLAAMAPGMLMEAASAARAIASLSRDTAQGCLRHDALVALDQAVAHMENVTYLGGQLVANGEDIMAELRSAAAAYKRDDFREFGQDFGTALRKVFLSSAEGNILPEGLPAEAVIANVTRGFITGMFGDGTVLDLSVAAGANHRAPREMRVDLHQCVGGNLAFLQGVWQQVMFFYAQGSAGVPSRGQMSFGAALSTTVLRLPEAMARCQLGPEQQEMLRDAIAGLAHDAGGVRYSLKAPPSVQTSSTELEKQFGESLTDWDDMHWESFGHDMGQLLQEVAVKAFSQKYAVDNGVLRRRVQQLSALPGPGDRAPSAHLAVAVMGLAALCAALVSQLVLRAAGSGCQEAQPPGSDSRATGLRLHGSRQAYLLAA